MKKKIIAGIMSMMMVAAMVVPVSANNKQTTKLEIDVESVYTMAIPMGQSIQFKEEATLLEGELAITGTIRPTEEIVIAVTKTEFTSSDDTDDVIAYSLTSEGEAFTKATWNEENLHSETPKTYPLTVNITEAAWQAAHAGNYKSVITFTVELKSTTP